MPHFTRTTHSQRRNMTVRAEEQPPLPPVDPQEKATKGSTSQVRETTQLGKACCIVLLCISQQCKNDCHPQSIRGPEAIARHGSFCADANLIFYMPADACDCNESKVLSASLCVCHAPFLSALLLSAV